LSPRPDKLGYPPTFSDIGKVTDLHWLPSLPEWRERLIALSQDQKPSWNEALALSNVRLNFLLTNRLDQTIQQAFPGGPIDPSVKHVRLALLGSSTLTHLAPAIRIAGLRRSLWVETYETGYGQYLQELADPNSALHKFTPTTILLALDAYHLSAGVTSGMDYASAELALDEVLQRVCSAWHEIREAFRCPIIQQTALPVHLPLLGNNEHRLPGSRARFLGQFNAALRRTAAPEGVALLALDDRVVRDGIARWHDPALWHRSKQEVVPTAAPMYGELVGRLLAAKQGRSYKCLVLDLDNTIWGGVIGDDGIEGIVLGQGSPMGEAYAAFQEYARELARRGVILAVCSKNDETNALEPFEQHPDMVLRRHDIASFVANWTDKVSNIRAIADELSIGLDSLVFIDDNPFERNLVRQELPMVAVPEVADDPTYYPHAISDAGYFESLAVTDEDRDRTDQYQSNRAREALKASATDIAGYLRGLEMRLLWKRFDRVGIQRIVQLINKSNQFNLTTRRYSEEDVFAVMGDANSFGLQLRLIDRFGDNGVIAIVVGRLLDNKDLDIDTWLMSCRVLGRDVEPTTLNIIASEAKALCARRLVGRYIPTKKNGMVSQHYRKLGFIVMQEDINSGSIALLELVNFMPKQTSIQVMQG
jgi:FkbH-like protein